MQLLTTTIARQHSTNPGAMGLTGLRLRNPGFLPDAQEQAAPGNVQQCGPTGETDDRLNRAELVDNELSYKRALATGELRGAFTLRRPLEL